MSSTILISDQAVVKRNIGVFFKSTKEKPRVLELHMVSGAQSVALKVFRAGPKGGSEFSFAVPISADSSLLTDLPNEPCLSFTIPSKKKEEECVFIFEDENVFEAWRVTLMTCIVCLNVHNHITDALYLQHLNDATADEGQVMMHHSNADFKPAEGGTADSWGAPNFAPPGPTEAISGTVPAKPPKPLAGERYTLRTGNDSECRLGPGETNRLMPAPLPDRPGADTPNVKLGDAVAVNQMSSKPMASAGRSDRFYRSGNLPQIVVTAENPISMRAGRMHFQDNPTSTSEIDESLLMSTYQSSPPPRKSVIPSSSITAEHPPSPPTRWSDRVLEGYTTVNRTLDYQPSEQKQPSKGQSEFINNREIQALTAMNEQLNAAFDKIEEQRLSDQSSFLKEVVTLKEDLAVSKTLATALQAEKAILEEDLNRTNDALTSMALMKDSSAETAKINADKVEELTAYIADVEARAERGDDSKALLSLRDSLKSTKERCLVLEKASDAKNQDLAAVNTQLGKYQEELRSLKMDLEDKHISNTVLKSTGEALLEQVGRLKEELFVSQTLRQEEQSRCQRDVERARAQLDVEKSERIAELDELKLSLRKREKTINMYEASTVEQQNKIRVMTESLEAFAATKKELAAYISNADMLTNAARVAQDVSQRLEKELLVANNQLTAVEGDKNSIIAAKRVMESKHEEEIESLQIAKRQAVAQGAQLSSSLSILQTKHDALSEKCARLEQEIVDEQYLHVSEMKAQLKLLQVAQDRFDEDSRTQRDTLAKSNLNENILNASIEKMKRSLKQTEDTLADKTQVHADSIARISVQDSEIAVLESKLAENLRTIKALEKKSRQAVEMTQERETALQHTISDLEMKIEANLQDLSETNVRLQAITVALRQSENDKRTKEFALHEALRDNQDLGARLISVSALHNEVGEKLYTTATELDVLKRLHDGLKTAKQGLEATLKDRGQEVTDLTVALSAARSKEAMIENLNAQVKVLEQSVAQKNVLVLGAEHTISQQNEKIHELEVASTAVTPEIASLKAQISSQRERLQQNADQMNIFRSSLLLIERERDELSSEVAESRMSISEFKSANSMLQMQIDACRRDIGSQIQQIARLDQVIVTGETDRSALLETVRKSEEKCSDFRELNATINEKLESSERRHRLQNQDIEDHKRNIDALEREKTSLCQSLDSSSERMRGMLTLDESSARVDRLTSMWMSEKEALIQKTHMLNSRLETERLSNVRGREELALALKGLVIGGDISFKRSKHVNSSNEGGALAPIENHNNPFYALESDSNAPVGVSFGELYTDILRVAGASETLKAASLDLVNHIVVQYTHNLGDGQGNISMLHSYTDSSRPVEKILAEARLLFDEYRTREREAATTIVKAARDEADARQFADEQAGEMRQLLKQTESKLEALRASKEASERRASAEVSSLVF